MRQFDSEPPDQNRDRGGCASAAQPTPLHQPTPAPVATPAPAPTPAPAQIFHGSGQQDIGTITVPTDSTISWNCPSCGNTNFIIDNAKSDADYIPTNALDQTQGVDTVSAGVYHTVVVDTTGGPWTVAIGTTAPAPPTSSSAPPQSSSSGPPSASAAADTQPASGTIATLPNQCSPGLSATEAISCGLASNLFYEYYKAEQSGGTTALSAWSSATRQYYDASCSSANGLITCSVSGTSDPNAQVEITQAALDAYSPQQASSYAAKSDLGPNG